MQTGRAIRGTIAFEGTAERPSAATLLSTGIVPQPADGRDMGGFAPARIEENLMFTTVGLPPGRYLISLLPVLRGWHLKSVAASGRESRDAGVEVTGAEDVQVTVTLVDELALLSGAVVGAVTIPPEASVYLFTAEKSMWNASGLHRDRFREARPPRSGSFAFEQLRSGEYFLAAAVLKRPDLWRLPESLDDLARFGVKVTIGDRESAVRSIPLRRQ